jgi:hypothetical protein
MFAEVDLLHAALPTDTPRQSYIRVEVAITEFCGRSQDYFSRVKAADKNKILGDRPGSAIRCRVPDKLIYFMGFQ